MDSKWLEIYRPKLNYDENLKLLALDFEKMLRNCKSSRFGEIEDEYILLGVIGEGAFGTVVLCKNKISKKVVAVKILLKEHIIDKNQVAHVMFEKNILNSICFPFLIYLEFSLKNNSCLYLGLPFIDGVELFTYLREMRYFKEDEAKFYAAQIVLAIEYLHKLNVIYRDLKPENLLMDHNGYIKLTDLGFAKKVDTRTYTFCGTPEYFSPELILNQAYSKSVDWWAFGVLIYEFVAGTTPFRTANSMLMFDKICAAKYSIPHYCTKELKDLVYNLLQVNISKRYGCMKNTSKDIKNHKWFKNTNWIMILNRDVVPFYLPRIKKESSSTSFTEEHLKKINKKDKNDVYSEEFQNF